MARVLDKGAQEVRRDVVNRRNCTVYVGGPRVFDVDKIVDIRSVTTKVEYRVKWTGYTAKYNEWVAERNIAPELRRTFSIEKKRKEIKVLKEKKAKARLMRIKHGRGKMTNGLTSISLAIPSTSRVISTSIANCNGKGTPLPVTTALEPDTQIPEWIAPKEDNEESDAPMSDDSGEYELDITKCTASEQDCKGKDTLSPESDQSGIEEREWSTSERGNEGNDASMLAESSESGLVQELNASKKMNEANDVTLVSSFQSRTLAVKSESNINSMSVASSKSDDPGLVQERNDSTKMNEENDESVSETLPLESTIETTRRESDESSIQSWTLAVDSDWDIDSMSGGSSKSDESGVVQERNDSTKMNEENGALVLPIESTNLRRESDQTSFQSLAPVAKSESCLRSMSGGSSKSDESGVVQERNDSTKINEENDVSVSETLPFESTIETTRRESDQTFFQSLAPAVESESDIGSMSDGSSKSDEPGVVQERNGSTKMSEENGKLVLLIEFTNLRRESDQSTIQSWTPAVQSESDVDSFDKKREPKEYLLGFNESLEPVFLYL